MNTLGMRQEDAVDREGYAPFLYIHQVWLQYYFYSLRDQSILGVQRSTFKRDCVTCRNYVVALGSLFRLVNTNDSLGFSFLPCPPLSKRPFFTLNRISSEYCKQSTEGAQQLKIPPRSSTSPVLLSLNSFYNTKVLGVL